MDNERLNDIIGQIFQACKARYVSKLKYRLFIALIFNYLL